MTLPFDAPATTGRRFITLASNVATTVLQTIKAGWAVAAQSPDVNPDATEVVMTERLRDGMRHVLNAESLPWGGDLVVQSGTESRSRPDVLLPDGRTDIPILSIEIFRRFREHDPHAIIECKRIAGTNTHLCREYVVEGIDRFGTGKYGAAHAAGFMAGYLIAGDANEAASRINRHLNSRRRGRKPRRDENLMPSTLVDEPWARVSRHPRSAAPVELHHAFLPTS